MDKCKSSASIEEVDKNLINKTYNNVPQNHECEENKIKIL